MTNTLLARFPAGFRPRWHALTSAALLWAVLAAAAATGGELQVDEAARRIVFKGAVARQGQYKDQLKGSIEYLLCCPGGKEYECLFACPVDVAALHAALVRIGVKPGRAAYEDGNKYVMPAGGGVRIFIEWNDGKEQRRARAESFVFDAIHGKPMQDVDWTFTGSREVKNPDTGEPMLQAVIVKNIASLHHMDQTVLLQNPLADAAKENRYKVNAAALPKEGTPVTVIMDAAPPPQAATPAGSRRIHLLISGSVQGVGFREFTRRSARQLGIQGWVRNLPSGEVELEAEGVEASIKDFEEQLNKGPRSAKVDKVQSVKASTDALGDFDILETPAK